MLGFNLFGKKNMAAVPEEVTSEEPTQVEEPEPQKVKQPKEPNPKVKEPREPKSEKEKAAKVKKSKKGKEVSTAAPAKYDAEAKYQENARNYNRDSFYTNPKNIEEFRRNIRTGYSSIASPDSPLGRGEAISIAMKNEQEMKAAQAAAAANASGGGGNEQNDVDTILPAPPLVGIHQRGGGLMSSGELLGHGTKTENHGAEMTHQDTSTNRGGSLSHSNGGSQALDDGNPQPVARKLFQRQGKQGSSSLGANKSQSLPHGHPRSLDHEGSPTFDKNPQYLGPGNFYTDDRFGPQDLGEPAVASGVGLTCGVSLDTMKVEAGSKASARIKGEGRNLSNWYLNEESIADLEAAKDWVPRFLYRACIVPDETHTSFIFGEGVANISAVNVKGAKIIIKKSVDNPLTDNTFATWSSSLIFALVCAWRAADSGTNAKNIFICFLDTVRTTCVTIFPTEALLFDLGIYDSTNLETLRLRHGGEFLLTELKDGDAEMEMIPYAKLLRLGLEKYILPEIVEGRSMACPRAQLWCVREKTFNSNRKFAVGRHESKAALAIASTLGDKNVMPFLTALLTMRARKNRDKRFLEVAMKVPGGADYPRYYLYKNADQGVPIGMPDIAQFAEFSCMLLEQIAGIMLAALPTSRLRRFLVNHGLTLAE